MSHPLSGSVLKGGDEPRCGNDQRHAGEENQDQHHLAKCIIIDRSIELKSAPYPCDDVQPDPGHDDPHREADPVDDVPDKQGRQILIRDGAQLSQKGHRPFRQIRAALHCGKAKLS
jgi:hypothetical protein